MPSSDYSMMLIFNVNTAHDLENSKACNKHQVNFVTGVYPSRRDK